jgi:hypothetical protein
LHVKQFPFVAIATAAKLGLALPHSALAPSGQDVWLEISRQSALQGKDHHADAGASGLPRKCTKNVLRLQERIKRNKTVVYFMFVDVSGNKT